MENNVKPMPTRPRSASRRASGDGAAPDADLLLASIAGRLRGCVESLPSTAEEVRELVHDCARALDQLRPGLTQERGYGQRIERELQEVRSALAAARLDLIGTRDGERRALHLAEHDSLTGLPNRGCFDKRLEEALSKNGQHADGFDGAAGVNEDHGEPILAVLFLDLDDFKLVNDKHGHAAGDELLRIIAQRLARAVRAGDLVSRYGGDEFVCLMSAPMTRDQLSHVACKLFDAVSAPLTVGSLEMTIRPSIGIAVCPSDGTSGSVLLQNADAAMYRAKRRQLGYCFFDARMHP